MSPFSVQLHQLRRVTRRLWRMASELWCVSIIIGLCATHFLTCVQKHNRYTKLIFSDKISVVNFTKNLATDVRYIFMYVEYF